MTSLRQRLIDDLTLRGYAQRTIATYVAAVARLSRFFHVAPDQLTEEQLRTYLVQLTKTRSAATVAQALCALRFFYEQTLGREWTTLELARPPRDTKLPTVLSREEVARVLAAIRMPTYRVCATTIYTCGLRLLEAIHLRVSDVAGARGLLHIHHGKGGMDRMVPLPRRRSPCCARTGAPIGIPSGSSRRRRRGGRPTGPAPRAARSTRLRCNGLSLTRWPPVA